jgi:hypothetical protein
VPEHFAGAGADRDGKCHFSHIFGKCSHPKIYILSNSAKKQFCSSGWLSHKPMDFNSLIGLRTSFWSNRPPKEEGTIRV